MTGRESENPDTAHPSLLAGKLTDAQGEALIASHATKGSTRYRYYIGRGLAGGGAGPRIPALEIEAAVTTRVADAFDDPFAIASSAGLTLTAATIASYAQAAGDIAGLLRKRHRITTLALVDEVRVHPGRIEIECATAAIAAALGATAPADAPLSLTLVSEVTLTRSGRAMRLVQDNGVAVQRVASPALLRLLVKARRWWNTLREGELDISQLAAAEGVMPAYITRVVRLAFLSPAVTQAALTGSLRGDVDVGSLTLRGPIPACWRAQAAAMLPA